MLFDKRPKNRQSDMYGRDKEISRLRSYIDAKTPGIVVKGFRRVGKTSILQTVLNESVDHYVFVDMRDLSSEGISKKSIIAKFQSSVNVFLSKNRSSKQRLVDGLKNVSGVTVVGSGVRFGWQRGREVDLAQTFKELDSWASESNCVVVIAIDEAQILSQSRYYNVAGILASIYDNCRNLLIVLTGSAFRLLDEFMGLDNPTSYLFGRDFEEIHVPRLSEKQSAELLRRGFAELGGSFENDPDFDDIVDEAAARLGGIIGWLVMFGARCKARGKISKSDIPAIQNRGANLAGQEFDAFLGRRRGARRYRDIMEFVAESPRTWTEIKEILAERAPGISDSNILLLIDTLSKNGFLDYDGRAKRYIVPDPLLAFFFR